MSVVVPCYNYAHFLPDAVSSVLTQTGVEIELIVVDDASTDSSAMIVEALSKVDARARLIRHSRNRGPVETFNDGLAAITGEFVVRLDADDMLTPGSLSRSVDLARAFPTVGLVYGHPIHFFESSDPKESLRGWGRPVTVAPGSRAPFRSRVHSWTVWPGRRWLADRCRTGLNVITSPEVLMRASVVDRVGGQKSLAHTHDMEMWLRLSAVSDVAHIEGADQAWHREHPNSLSRDLSDPVHEIRERHAAFEMFFAGIGGELAEADHLHDLASRALARATLRYAAHECDRGRCDTTSIVALRDCAIDFYPGAAELPAWRSLRRRERVQSSWPWRISPLAGAAVLRRLEYELFLTRWMRWGV
ncbi:glycosyltransferase family 2 protein [Rhodococcus sp. NPDC127528]|uniref:glycosyltransferase family 2 protein n=1 Tax=unclassified Rhodococcus (in: high G+C Gram-positive bacteria) TaxID=192944 RepID=UPI003634C708